jgi:hypothetical protein
MPTLRRLFDRIAGSGGLLTKDKLHQFVEDAGVSDSFLMPKATLAAGAFMDKFDDGSGSVSWDRFRKRGVALVPPGLMKEVDAERVAHEIDARWSEIDPKGRGAVDVGSLSNFIEAQLAARGQMFAGTKADAGAKVLLHALDDNGDHLLQKDELKGFLLDVAREATGP